MNLNCDNKDKKTILIVVGPTAVGKTEYALELAEKFDSEIISADSMQIYKYMDIGSAKPSTEELKRVRHHLIGEIDPRENFSVANYEKIAKERIEGIFKKGKTPLIAGGTGLYVNSIIFQMDFSLPSSTLEYRKKMENLKEEKGSLFLYEMLKEKDEKLASRIHQNNSQKIIRALEVIETSEQTIKPFDESKKKTKDYNFLIVGLNRDREELYNRINIRVDKLVEIGLIDEIRMLLSKGLTEKDISMKGIGYKEIINSLKGEYSLDEAIELVKRNSRRYAKRQLTWFRKYEELDEFRWFNLSEIDDNKKALEEIYRWIKSKM